VIKDVEVGIGLIKGVYNVPIDIILITKEYALRFLIIAKYLTPLTDSVVHATRDIR
jgi:hypothetical protein